jgi:antitoxin HicB
LIDRARECPRIAVVGSQKRHGAMDRVHRFAVVLEPEEEGGFTVRVPSLPEIVTFGKDEDEALAMAEDAIRLVLEDCLARGEPIPSNEPPRVREVTVTLAA